MNMQTGNAQGMGGGSNNTAGSAGATAGGSAGTSSQGGSAGSGGTSAAVSYPAGPYGQSPGGIVEDLSFQGLLAPKASSYNFTPSTVTTISFHDFYNPTDDPSKPRLLLVDASALWCSACMDEAMIMDAKWQQWHPKRVQFLTAVFEDANHNPSVLASANTWASTYGLEYPVVIDPSLQLGAFFDQSAAPFVMVIDLRTMKMVYGMTGEFFPNGVGDGVLMQNLQ